MPGCVELLSPCPQSLLSALTGAPTHPDGSGSLRSLVSAIRCVAPGYKTVPRMPILAVPSATAASRYNSIVPNGSIGCRDLLGDRERLERANSNLDCGRFSLSSAAPLRCAGSVAPAAQAPRLRGR